MGVSFKIAKVRIRYRPPMVLQIENNDSENEGNFSGVEDNAVDHSNAMARLGSSSVSEDLEVSFTLNLFYNGYSIGKPTELFMDVPTLLLPYDRESDKLFSAIEIGCIPGDLIDDIPCKYVKGAILCEIQDYRKCYPCKINGASYVNSFPTIHKVSLQMRMENVVKDMPSISNNSWTYEDQLRAESWILMTMQPNLFLNPKPMLDRLCKDIMPKKINLDIPWSWKKRKLSDAPATGLSFNEFFHKANVPGVSLTHSVPTAPGLSDLFFAPRQFYSNCYGDSEEKELDTSVIGNRGRCDMQAIGGPVLLKSTQELLDFSQPQLWRSQAETVIAPDLQLRSRLEQQQLEATNFIHETLVGDADNNCDMMLNNNQHAVLGDVPNLEAEMPNFMMRQELTVTSSQPNVVEISKLQHSSPSTKATISRSSMQGNHVGQPGGKNMRSETVNQKRNAPHNHDVCTGGVSIPVTTCLSDYSTPRKSSQPAKKKSNPHSKVSSSKAARSASTTNMNEVNESSPPMAHVCLPKPSRTRRDPFLARLSKIKMVTERHGLLHRSDKSNEVSGKGPFMFTNPLVNFHILNSMDSENSTHAPTDPISLSMCFHDRSPNFSKTRTLTFKRSPRINQGNKVAYVDNEEQKKLVISEKLNEGIFKATVLYGNGEVIDSVDFPFPPTSCTHYANLFATQLTSLMLREGYELSSDQIESTPLICEQPRATSSSILKTGTVEAASRGLMPFPLPHMLTSPISSTSGSTSALNFQQSPTQNNLSNSHMLPDENFQSPLELSQFFTSQLDTAAQLSSMHQQQYWSDIINKRAVIQSQAEETQRPSQFLQRNMMMAGGFGMSGDSLGTVQLGGGIQGIANTGLGSFSGIMGMEASTSFSVGGQTIDGLSNMSWVNNLESNITGMEASTSFSVGRHSLDGLSNMSQFNNLGSNITDMETSTSSVGRHSLDGLSNMSQFNILGSNITGMEASTSFSVGRHSLDGLSNISQFNNLGNNFTGMEASTSFSFGGQTIDGLSNMSRINNLESNITGMEASTSFSVGRHSLDGLSNMSQFNNLGSNITGMEASTSFSVGRHSLDGLSNISQFNNLRSNITGMEASTSFSFGGQTIDGLSNMSRVNNLESNITGMEASTSFSFRGQTIDELSYMSRVNNLGSNITGMEASTLFSVGRHSLDELSNMSQLNNLGSNITGTEASTSFSVGRHTLDGLSNMSQFNNLGSNITGMEASTSFSVGGHTLDWLSNMSQFNNLGSNITGMEASTSFSVGRHSLEGLSNMSQFNTLGSNITGMEASTSFSVGGHTLDGLSNMSQFNNLGSNIMGMEASTSFSVGGHTLDGLSNMSQFNNLGSNITGMDASTSFSVGGHTLDGLSNMSQIYNLGSNITGMEASTSFSVRGHTLDGLSNMSQFNNLGSNITGMETSTSFSVGGHTLDELSNMSQFNNLGSNITGMEASTSFSVGGHTLDGLSNMSQIYNLRSNITGMEASTSFSIGGHTLDGLSNMSQFYNLGSNITDPLAAAMEIKERVMMSGVSNQKDASVIAMQQLNIHDLALALNLTNHHQQLPQQLFQQQMQQQSPSLQQQLQQETRSPLFPSSSLIALMDAPLNQLSPLQFNHQPQTNLQQLNAGYAHQQQQQIGLGNVAVVGLEHPEPISTNASSPLSLSDMDWDISIFNIDEL